MSLGTNRAKGNLSKNAQLKNLATACFKKNRFSFENIPINRKNQNKAYLAFDCVCKITTDRRKAETLNQSFNTCLHANALLWKRH